MNGANLRLVLPSLSVLAHAQVGFKPEALRMRRWVQGMQASMCMEDFHQLYALFMGDEDVYGEAA